MVTLKRASAVARLEQSLLAGILQQNTGPVPAHGTGGRAAPP